MRIVNCVPLRPYLRFSLQSPCFGWWHWASTPTHLDGSSRAQSDVKTLRPKSGRSITSSLCFVAAAGAGSASAGAGAGSAAAFGDANRANEDVFPDEEEEDDDEDELLDVDLAVVLVLEDAGNVEDDDPDSDRTRRRTTSLLFGLAFGFGMGSERRSSAEARTAASVPLSGNWPVRLTDNRVVMYDGVVVLVELHRIITRAFFCSNHGIKTLERLLCCGIVKRLMLVQ